MKKLMIAACAVVCATVAQAVAVNWYAGELNGPGITGGWGTTAIDGSAYSAQFIMGSSYSGSAGSYEIGDIVTFASGATASAAEGGFIYGTTDSATLAQKDATYYAQVIITSGDYILKSQVVEVHTASAAAVAEYYFGPSDPSNITALPGESLDTNYGAFSSAGWQSVPEPTSGLLLLIGMAGLALRRRRA